MRRILPGIAFLLLASALLFAATPGPQDPRANGTFVTPIPDAPFTAVDTPCALFHWNFVQILDWQG